MLNPITNTSTIQSPIGMNTHILLRKIYNFIEKPLIYTYSTQQGRIFKAIPPGIRGISAFFLILYRCSS
jgi:hypothetical protein